MCQRPTTRSVRPKSSTVDQQQSEHHNKNDKHHTRFPVVFLVWCSVKTVFQLTISSLSILFILQSGFFLPGHYDATVWTREELLALFIPQALFELIDLGFETWMTLFIQKNNDHLPWDSIVHHSATAAYYYYIWSTSSSLSHAFLGLPVAGLSCQVIGWLYTAYRLRFRFQSIGLMLLLVQSLYRCPLAVASLFRAVQFYSHAPLIHFLICALLANLDIRWTLWSYNLFKRMKMNL